jgi:hypothetical protein
MRWWLLCAFACSSERAPAAKLEAGSAVKPVIVADAAPAAIVDAVASEHERHVAQLAWIEHQICALMNDGALRCWGDRKATPVERDAPVPFARIGRDHGIDRANNLYRLQGSWDKPIANVRAFAGESRYAVTAYLDGRLEVSGAKDRLPARATGDHWVRVAAVDGVPDPVEVISTLWPDGMGRRKVHHSCARTKAGAVYCWFEDLEPRVVPGLVASQIVETGGDHICALDDKRRVRCWSSHGKTGTPKLRHVAGLDGANVIAGGGSSSPNSPQGRVCALFDESVACADVASYYIGSPKIEPPVRILVKASTLLAGDGFACGVARDGVLCWGDNQVGQLGDGTLTDSATPVRVKYLLDDKLPPAETGHGKEQQSTVEMDWGGLPAACKQPSSVFGVPIVSAYAARTRENMLRVWLASYRLDPKRPHLDPRGAQQVLAVTIEREVPRTFEKRPLDLQPYVAGNEVERSIYIKHATGEKLGLRATKPLVDGDRFQPAVLDDAWVCGTLVTDKGKTATPIAARVVPRE